MVCARATINTQDFASLFNWRTLKAAEKKTC